MKRKMIRRGFAAFLCMAMLLSLPALAVFEEDEIQEIPVVSETDVVAELPEVPVEAPFDDGSLGEQAQPMASTVFSVTVPTTVAIHMDASGGITCGDIVITNNSTDAVLIKDTQVSALNGWTLVDYATTIFTDADRGQHRMALQFARGNGITAAGVNTGEDIIPSGGGRQTVSVAAKIPYQGVPLTNATIAQVVFVLGWKDPPPAVPADALKSFTITVAEDGYTRNGGTWSDSDNVELHIVSQVGNNVRYEGTCSLTAPYNNYMVHNPTITYIPNNLKDGIVSIEIDTVKFTCDNGTWKGGAPLFYAGSTGGTFGVQLELSLDVSTTVKDPTPVPSTPTPTPT